MAAPAWQCDRPGGDVRVIDGRPYQDDEKGCKDRPGVTPAYLDDMEMNGSEGVTS